MMTASARPRKSPRCRIGERRPPATLHPLAGRHRVHPDQCRQRPARRGPGDARRRGGGGSGRGDQGRRRPVDRVRDARPVAAVRGARRERRRARLLLRREPGLRRAGRHRAGHAGGDHRRSRTTASTSTVRSTPRARCGPSSATWPPATSTQGGSTLTQQYVKMVQIEEAEEGGDQAGVEAAQDGTYGRKIRELRYAISVEKTLTKDEILERYLNIAYFGDGAYGIEVAAEHYFGTTADEADASPQAALLAGLVQNPTAFNPVAHRRAALQRRDVVLNRMAELGVITERRRRPRPSKRVRQEEGQDHHQRLPGQPTTRSSATTSTARCADAEPGRQPSRSASRRVKRGGLTIKTAIDPTTQDAIQKAVSDVGRSDRPGDRGDGHDRARHGPDRGDGAEPAGDGRRRQEGPDLLELLGRPGDGWRPGLPGRLDLQGVHRGRGAGEGHPAVQALRRPRDDGLLRRALRELRGPHGQVAGELAGQQLHRRQRRDGHVPGRASTR